MIRGGGGYAVGAYSQKSLCFVLEQDIYRLHNTYSTQEDKKTVQTWLKIVK